MKNREVDQNIITQQKNLLKHCPLSRHIDPLTGHEPQAVGVLCIPPESIFFRYPSQFHSFETRLLGEEGNRFRKSKLLLSYSFDIAGLRLYRIILLCICHHLSPTLSRSLSTFALDTISGMSPAKNTFILHGCLVMKSVCNNCKQKCCLVQFIQR